MNKYARLILCVILLVIIHIYAFTPVPCDVDKQYLYCHLNPLKLWDVLGLVLFNGSALLYVGGILDVLGIEIYSKHGHKGSWIAGLAALAGIGLLFV